MNGATSVRAASSPAPFLAACLGALVVYLDVSAVNVATTAIGHDLGGGLSTLEWVVNGYTLSFGSLLLTAGTLSDAVGPHRAFRAGVVLFTLSSLACALAPAQPVLITARTLQGAGGALVIPAALSVLRAAFPDPHRRTRAVGLWSALGGSLALAIGPVAGGVLVGHLGWRSIFLINLPIGALAIALTGGGTGKPVSRRAIDVPGQLAAISGLVALTLALTETSVLGWSAPVVVVCLAIFAVTLTTFALVERRSSTPMVPQRLFSNTGFLTAAAAGTLVNFAFYGLIFALSLFFQHAWKLSPTAAGVAFLPLTASLGISNLGAARLSAYWSPRVVLVIGFALSIGGYAATAATVGHQPSLSILVPLLVAGAGIGLIVPTLTTAMLAVTEPGDAGITAGVLNTLRQAGGIVGVAVMGMVGGTGETPPAIRACLLAAVIALGAGGISSGFGLRTRPPR